MAGTFCRGAGLTDTSLRRRAESLTWLKKGRRWGGGGHSGQILGWGRVLGGRRWAWSSVSPAPEAPSRMEQDGEQDGRRLEFVISPASASPSHGCSCAVVSETGLAVHSSANCFDKRL